METFRFQPGETPVLISLPHVGTDIPLDIAESMTDAAHEVGDTDWHLDRLYNFAPALGVGFLAATQSRYVIDLNRDPKGHALYRGGDNTELCPTSAFNFSPLYRNGCEPDAVEVRRRLAAYWHPYHRQLDAELAALKERFGIAILFDAHSIKSRVPRLFQGQLHDFNLGTADGTSASPHLSGRLMNVLSSSDRYSTVLDQRFKGGYITRHYADPARGIDAIQLEISQRIYMDEDTFEYDPNKAADAQAVIRSLLEAAS
jgi:N-formylglutamate deformylase